MYFGTTGSTDSTASFQNINEQTAYLTTALNNLSPNGFISGSGTNTYPLKGGYVYNIFDKVVEGASYFRTGSTALSLFPSYSVQETGNHLIQASIPFTYEVSTLPVNEATWSLQVWKRDLLGNETLIANGIDRQYFVAGDPATSTLTFDYYSGDFVFYLSDAIPSTNVTIGVGARVYGYTDTEFCNTRDSSETDTLTNPAVITAGTNTISVPGSNQLTCASSVFKRRGNITVNGQNVSNGQIITIGGTQVTIQIYSGCENYPC